MDRDTTTHQTETEATFAFTRYELELLSAHVGRIYTDVGRLRMGVRGPFAEVSIEPTEMSKADDIWASVTINGRSCGNRHGGAKAYARLMAGDPDWFRS